MAAVGSAGEDIPPSSRTHGEDICLRSEPARKTFRIISRDALSQGRYPYLPEEDIPNPNRLQTTGASCYSRGGQQLRRPATWPFHGRGSFGRRINSRQGPPYLVGTVWTECGVIFFLKCEIEVLCYFCNLSIVIAFQLCHLFLYSLCAVVCRSLTDVWVTDSCQSPDKWKRGRRRPQEGCQLIK